jgi:lambda family phage portal protein
MAKLNAIDRAIAVISPQTALNRAGARARLALIQNSGYGNYGANTAKKSLRGWHFGGGSSLEDIEDNIDVLRQRSRDVYMGVPIAAGALKTLRTHAVGSGLMAKPQIDGEYLHLTNEETKKLEADIEREFCLWADTPDCDMERIDDFYSLQQLAFLSWVMNGDCIALMPTSRRKGQPYDLRVQLIEADRLCNPPGPCVDPLIVQGVETNARGEVVAYHICSRHPLSYRSDAVGKTEWVRVEAYGKRTGRKNVLHIMTRERIGQRRGVPFLAPVIEAIKQLGRYTDAEIVAAVVSGMFTVFIQKDNAADGMPLGEVGTDGDGAPLPDDGTVAMGNGAIVDLNPGETVNFANPSRPAGNFAPFVEAIVRQIGAGLEIPYEVLMKTFNSSYSASRGAMAEFWQTVYMLRDWLASDFCQPIYEEWMAEAVATGRINAPGFFNDPAVRKAYCGCTWNGPAPIQLDPNREVKAAIDRVENGFSTAQQETAQLTGGDYAKNIAQRKIEKQLKQEVDNIGRAKQNAQPEPTK